MTRLPKIIILIFISLSSLNTFGQTDEIKFNNNLDRLKYYKSSPNKVKRLFGAPTATDEAKGGWMTRTDGCFKFNSKTITYEKEGLAFEFRKIQKPFFVPLIFRHYFLCKTTITSSTKNILNTSIKINTSKMADIKAVFGEPTSAQTDDSELSYGYYDIIFYFDNSGTLIKMDLFSRKIDREAKSGF